MTQFLQLGKDAPQVDILAHTDQELLIPADKEPFEVGLFFGCLVVAITRVCILGLKEHLALDGKDVLNSLQPEIFRLKALRHAAILFTHGHDMGHDLIELVDVLVRLLIDILEIQVKQSVHDVTSQIAEHLDIEVYGF